MKFGIRDVNEKWASAMSEEDFVKYGMARWAQHHDFVRKTEPQKVEYLKAIHKQARILIPVAKDEKKKTGGEQ